MSKTIDQRVVEMQFDNKQFEKNVATSMTTLAGLKKSLDLTGASKGLENVSDAARKCDMSGLSNAVQTVQAKFSALEVMAITTLTNLTNSAVNAGKKMVSALTIDPVKTGFQEYETQINAVQTILANTQKEGATLGKVNSALDELNTYADKTIYNFTEMTRNIGTFTAAGVKLDNSVSAIKGIANLAAISGSTSQQASGAMYQLSQALAAGRVSLMDWNSVVNAGMGGQVFQDALKQTAKVMGIAVDESVSFRESISATGGNESWLTSEVLTKTLAQFTGDLTDAQLASEGFSEAQIKQIQTQAKMANDAATKVKTFTQLVDTLKESAQSGWSQSWRTIIGDFEEAKEFYTDVSNALGDLIGKSSDARNKVLTEGLASGWDQFLSQGVADEEAYIARIKNVAKERGLITEEMMSDITSFDDLQKQGLVTTDMLGEGLSLLTADLKDLSDEQLTELGYTSDQVSELQKLNKAVQNGTVNISDFVDKMSGASGRENLIDSLFNSGRALMSILNPISEAFNEIFTPITGEQLYSFTALLKELTSKLTLSGTASVNLKRTFKGLFAVLDIAKQAITALLRAVLPLFGGVDDLGGSVLDTTAGFGDWLVKLNETIKTTDVFNKIVQGMVGFVTNAATAVKDFVVAVAKKFNFPGIELLHSFLERVHERMSLVEAVAGNMGFGVVAAIELMSDAIKNSKFLQALEVLWRGVKTVVGGIASILGSLTNALIENMSNANFDSALDVMNILVAGGIGVGLKNFLKSLTETFEGLSDFKDGIVNVFDGVGGCLEAYQTQLKAGVLLKIASAIAILAAAILVISLIDSEKLAASLGAVTVLFGDLMGSMAVFSKIGGDLKGVVTACTAMVSISVAVLILAAALKTIGNLDIKQLATGLVGVVGLTATVVAAAKIMGSKSKTVIKGATQMVIFAAAIKMLATVCEDLSKLTWNELSKGLIGVSTLMAAISIFLKTAKFSRGAITTATGIVILAAAIKILASACSDFGKMRRDDIDKGLTSIGILLAEIAAFTSLTAKAKNVISTGIALIAIAAAMKIFASAVQDFSNISWETLGKSLGAMAVALLAITVAVRFMPANMIGIGLGLIALSTALIIMSAALNGFGDMRWGEIAKGLFVLGGAMAILAVALDFMTGTLAGSAALLVAVAALTVLTPVLSILGAMSWGSIVKGLVAIAGAFTIIGVAGLLLTPLVPTMLGIAGAFALVGVSILGIGVGLLAAGAGLSAVAVGFTALAVAGTAGAASIVAALTVIITGIIGLIPAIVKQLAEGLVTFCTVIADSVPLIFESIMKLVAGLWAALIKYEPQILDSIFQFLIGLLKSIAKNLPELIKVAVDVIMAFFSGVTDALSGIDTKVLLKGIVGIGLLSAIMITLSAVVPLIPGAMVGVLGMGVVIAEMALLLAAIGALAQIPGLSWLINEGGKLLQGIGKAIGSFVGGMVGGFMGGVSSQFPQIGTDLSSFMKNIQPFVDGAKSIDASAMAGVKALAETILLLTAANILDGLTSWITGGSSMAKFGEELAEFGPYFKKYYESIKGVDGSVVQSSANAAKAIAEFANEVPNSGGIAGWFAGENSLSAFAEELTAFGPKLKMYADSVKGLDANVVVNSANAAKALAEMANNLPNQGGVAGWFTGDNGLSKFAEELTEFGPKLKSYADSVTGLNADVVVNSANAAKALAEMANNLPDQGGVSSWFVGDNTLSTFGKELAAFGPNLKSYADSVSGLDTNVVTNSANAAKALAELSNNLPNSGGIFSWFSGDNDMASFGTQLVSFGQSFANYYESVRDINTTLLSEVVVEFKKLVELATGITDIDTSGMATFARNLTILGNSGIDSFIDAFTNAKYRVVVAATAMVNTFVTAAKNKQYMFTNTAAASVVKFIDGIESKHAGVANAGTQLASVCLTQIKNEYQDFYDSGRYLVEGFAFGITSCTYLAEAKARAMAGAAANAARQELDIHSPSKVAHGIGSYFGIGFVNAIGEYASKAYNASASMADSAKQGLSNAVSKITDVINGNIDTNPTIKPVLDLSDVETGTAKLNSLFSRTQAMSISNGMTRPVSNEIQNADKTSESGAVYSFTQNNYSPKALSRLEIYRQTKNQFSAMKGLVKA